MTREEAYRRANKVALERIEGLGLGSELIEQLVMDELADMPEDLAELAARQVAEQLVLVIQEIEARAGVPRARRCSRCGCTDTRGCPEGCSWVAPSVCSSCSPIASAAIGR